MPEIVERIGALSSSRIVPTVSQYAPAVLLFNDVKHDVGYRPKGPSGLTADVCAQFHDAGSAVGNPNREGAVLALVSWANWDWQGMVPFVCQPMRRVFKPRAAKQAGSPAYAPIFEKERLHSQTSPTGICFLRKRTEFAAYVDTAKQGVRYGMELTKVFAANNCEVLRGHAMDRSAL